MIPKIIHYCWFGNQKPDDVVRYIEGWREKCSDYQIIEWNEDNYDIQNCSYVLAALKEKKWAFVSDYIRYHVLYQYGGIYLDTDVEVLRNFDDLLHQRAFCGFEIDRIGTGIIGAEPFNGVIGAIKDVYDSISFYYQDGSLNLTTSPEYMTKVVQEYGFEVKNAQQNLEAITVYPSDYFSPYNLTTFECILTDRSHTIHHYMGSWLDGKARYRVKTQQILKKIIGNQMAYKLSMAMTIIKYEGLLGLFRTILKKKTRMKDNAGKKN